MAIVYSLVILLVFLIIYTVISSIIRVSLYITTRVSYENMRITLPVILSLVTWTLIVSLYIFTVNKYIGKNVFSEIFDIYIVKGSLATITRPIIVFGIIYLLAGIILQSFTYFTVNVKLENLFSYIRYYICKLFRPLKEKLKLKTKQKPENIVSKEPIEELTLGRAFISSIISTLMIILFITILAVIGTTIANKFISSLI